MSENQILAAITALATLGILYGNWRLADLRTSLDKRIDDFQISVRRELELTRELFRSELSSIRTEISKNHSELLSRIGDIERKQEGQPHA